MLRSNKELNGYRILAKDGDIGKIVDFFFDDDKWGVRYLVVDIGKWLKERKVLLSPVSVKDADWALQTIEVALTREQIKNSPEIDAEKPVSRQHEIRLHRYYQWPYYWSVGTFTGVGSPPVPVAVDIEEPDEEVEEGVHDPHLRSIEEVTNYRIHAVDSEFGHVEDFIVDDATWILRYMVIDTRNWLPGGKKVLIAPQWIDEFNWASANVRVSLTMEQIENSPKYEPSASINREYEERLYDFYGRPKYWL